MIGSCLRTNHNKGRVHSAPTVTPLCACKLELWLINLRLWNCVNASSGRGGLFFLVVFSLPLCFNLINSYTVGIRRKGAILRSAGLTERQCG